jgi:homoserine O-succinyltransferase
VNLELMHTTSHNPKNVPAEHMLSFYKSFDELKHRKFDGMVITGAPVELMDFEQVDYWDELCRIMEWSKTHVHSTFHICWGAQAGLYYHYGIDKQLLPEKLFGVFRHQADYKRAILLRGFDDTFWVPHSRNTTVSRESIEAVPGLKIIASSEEAGVYAVMSKEGRQIFVTGHGEYDPETLRNEYFRDLGQGLMTSVPKNYFPEDDPTREPIVRWRGHANLLFSNWLNYFVYQTTPYDIMTIGQN